MMSHSSKIKNFNLETSRCFLFTRSKTLPGVPTTMVGGVFLSILIWSSMESPPTIEALLIAGKYLPNLTISRLTWWASSLVWQSTRAERGSGLLLSKSCRSESTNTAVFPIPDLAWQRRSFPSIARGMQFIWTVVVGIFRDFLGIGMITTNLQKDVRSRLPKWLWWAQSWARSPWNQ